MMQSLISALGVPTGLLVAVLLTVSLLAWMPALAGLATVDLRAGYRRALRVLLVVCPPASLPVLGLLIFRETRAEDTLPGAMVAASARTVVPATEPRRAA